MFDMTRIEGDYFVNVARAFIAAFVDLGIKYQSGLFEEITWLIQQFHGHCHCNLARRCNFEEGYEIVFFSHFVLCCVFDLTSFKLNSNRELQKNKKYKQVNLFMF